MNPLAWLVSFLMPACGFPGAQGLPPPSLMDVAHISRPATPNTALAAPADFTPAPDITTPTYPVSADRLFALARAVAEAQPRTFQAALFAGQRQLHYVVRSALFNFPDLVMVQVQPESADSSDLILYSRSVYGESDLGVNRKRAEAWLAALQTKLPPASER
jgi:uncharacterized protein (DUF1499 family)